MSALGIRRLQPWEDAEAAPISISAACTGCGACIATCPERALLRAPRRPAVDGARCSLCLACVEVCPAGAIGLAGMSEDLGVLRQGTGRVAGAHRGFAARPAGDLRISRAPKDRG